MMMASVSSLVFSEQALRVLFLCNVCLAGAVAWGKVLEAVGGGLASTSLYVRRLQATV